MRRADVLARRRPDIAYDDVPDELAERAVEPGDPAFSTVRSTYLRGGRPGLVLRPSSVPQVVDAVSFARKHRHLPLGLRSGGHGISGRSTNDGGLVIDVGALNEITVLDEATRLVRIGPGARWRDVATALQPHGWALSSGDYGGVGVGGLATAGGIGFLARRHGLTIDHLRAVEMVLADGTFVRASAAENTELFWAARGAGANFGIAVAFEFVVDEVDEVGWAQLAFSAPDPAAYLEASARSRRDTTRDDTVLDPRQGVARVMAMVDSSDPEVVISQLQPFAEIAPLVQQQVVIAPYAAVMNMFPETPHDGRGEPVSRSAFAREMTPGFASASADLIRSGASHWYQIRTVGGAVADVAPDATAYAHRDANFSLAAMGANAQRLDRWFEPVRRESQGLYLSFESDRSPERITDAFPPPTLDRLRRLKAQLDPHNLFRDNFNFTPAHEAQEHLRTPAPARHEPRLRPGAAVRHVRHPDQPPPPAGRRAGCRRRPRGPGPGHLPGPPLPAEVPRHLHPAGLRRRPHRANPPVGERHQPPASPTGRARPGHRDPGPPQRRPHGAGARCRRVLGRCRRHGRSSTQPG